MHIQVIYHDGLDWECHFDYERGESASYDNDGSHSKVTLNEVWIGGGCMKPWLKDEVLQALEEKCCELMNEKH
jgi:hypothetical protein